MAAFDYLPQTRVSRAIDPLIKGMGRWVSLIWVLLLGVIVLNVLMRYAFSEGRIELEELQWHLYSIGFLLGLSYAYQADSHIRVDVIHERFGPQVQAWIELYGIILFLLPLIAMILVFSVPFVISSYSLNEVSQSPGGLPLRWVIKACLPLGFGLLLLAVISRLSRVWSFLFFSHANKEPSNGR
jgi:TRAP-type mannitol/chloroaromatic compound transport system permease small subunit